MTRFPVLPILLLASLGGVVTGQHYSSNIRCFARERRALLKFKDELVDEYGRLSSWGIGINKRECCKWRGVHCHNRTNHVTQLNLRNPQGSYHPLKGKVSPSLLELKHLTYLDLSYNDFGYSNFPEFIGSFEKLEYLNLSIANLSKSIPPSVGNLSELKYLDLSWNFALYSNNLEWVSHLASLKYLGLSNVKLRNASNWLQAISKLTSIEELHFSGCVLQNIHPFSLPPINSSVPLAILDLSMNSYISSSTFRWFLNFTRSLTFIDLSHNNITSLLSTFALDNQIFLAHLDLSYNELEGGVPKSVGNMSDLTYLNLRRNRLTDPLSDSLSGPLEMKLNHLDLSDNTITGSLPDFSRFSFLNRLALQGNRLNGSIAKGHLNITNLIHLDLSSNNFTGPIPDLTFSLFLQKLYLYNNMFSGPLRESLGCLSKMEVLALSSNNFEGVVTESHLFNLSSLQFLDLSHNSLLTLNCSTRWIPPFQLIAIFLSQCKTGPVFPQWLQFQRKLEFLDISFSQIVDTIPSWFSNLPSTLVYLNASNNQMHGFLPDSEFSILNPSNSLSRSHKVLDLSRNQIAGPATFLCQNELWSFIDLSNNRFSDHLPSCFTSFTLLQFLNLANNHFSGYIPNSIGWLRDLFSLNLRNNSFSGGIPTSLRKCTKLRILDLGENRLTGNIQSWMGDSLLSLSILSLPFNEFQGIIPWSLCNLKNIQVLDLSSNKISGPIPKCLHNLTTMTVKTTFLWVWEFEYPDLEDLNQMNKSFNEGPYVMWKGKEVKCASGLVPVKLLDLSNNLLAGDIPDAITKLVGLNALNLSRNNLCGRIPPDIGDLKYLDSLDLSRNHLSGGIPVSLSELSFLGVLNLSYNNLTGRIPPQILKFDESAYMGNSGLCGHPILHKSCPGEEDINHQDSNFNSYGNDQTNNLEHEEDEFITQGFYICIGFGFMVGFWGIFGTVLIKMRVESSTISC